MGTKYFQYEKLLKKEQELNQLEKQGFKLLYNKSRIKKFIGVGCLVVAIIPNGTGLILYPFGFYLLAINKQDMFKHKENLLRKARVKIRGLLR